MQLGRIPVVMAVVLSCFGTASAQIVEDREVDGKTISCVRGGLISDLTDCGLPEWYSYIFIGSIFRITSIADEKELQIRPEEVFKGDPANILTVKTSQALCGPGFTAGDRWLFLLREEGGEPIVLDPYAGESRPVAEAQKQIETLRRLQTIGDSGIFRGRVQLDQSFLGGEGIPGARVVARRESDNMQFVTTSGADGSYEFEPIPPGKYKLTVDGSVHFDHSEIGIARGGCWDLTISKFPRGQLGGHVRGSDGLPVGNVPVLIMHDDEQWWTTSKTDESGFFQFDSLGPGKYVVGINLPGAPVWKYAGSAGVGADPRPASLYYPGLQDRSRALMISLSIDEKRDDINFTIANTVSK